MSSKNLQQSLDWLIANGISTEDSDIEEQNSVAFFNNIGYCFLKDGYKKFKELAQSLVSEKIHIEEAQDVLLEQILTAKTQSKKIEYVSIQKFVSDSVQKNTIIIPIAGIKVKKNLKIGIFTFTTKANSKNKVFKSLSSDYQDYYNKYMLDTVAVGTVECHPKSALKFGFEILSHELLRFKAFLPISTNNIHHLILPSTKQLNINNFGISFAATQRQACHQIVSSNLLLDIEWRISGRKDSIRTLLKKNKFNEIIECNSIIYTHLNKAFEWLGQCYDELDSSNKLLFSIIALENILNSEPDKYSSITAAVAEKSAFLLGRTSKGKLAVFEKVRKHYQLRSKIVHGSQTISHKDAQDAYIFAISVLIRIHRLAQKYHWKSLTELDQYLLEAKFSN